MSVSKWAYTPEVCDGGGCPGDCDLCDKPKNMEDEYDEWCTDCKEYDKERHCCPRWNKVIRDTADEIRQNADVVPKSIYEQTKWERDFAEKRADDMSKLIRNKDVVAVVRCKDCIHKMEDKYSDGNVPDLICKEWDSGVDAYDYCSYGERAEA